MDSLAPLFGVSDDPSMLSNLALTNILLGSAVPSGNVDTQISPVCSFQVVDCMNPLRLVGFHSQARLVRQIEKTSVRRLEKLPMSGDPILKA